MPPISRGFRGRRAATSTRRACRPGQYVVDGLPGAVGRPDAAHAARRVEPHDRRRRRRARTLDLGRAPARCRTETFTVDIHCVTKWSKLGTTWTGVSLDTLLERRRDRGRVPHRLVRRRLHDEPRARGRHRRQGLGRLRLRRRAARARARRPGAAARAAPVLLEEREVGARAHAHARRRAGLLGGRRLPQPRRPVARAAVLERLTSPRAGRLAARDACARSSSETAAARARSCSTSPAGPATVAGQHVDVRLTAEDGYQAQRSYSIASAPEDARLELTVERIDDGEVSPYLAGVAARRATSSRCAGRSAGTSPGASSDGGPLLLVAGGSGLVPLMAMLRHRAAPRRSDVDARLLVSARAPDDVLYRDELGRARRDVRGRTPRSRARSRRGWTGSSRRVDADMLAELGPPPERAPARVRVRPDARSSRRAADLLVELGHDRAARSMPSASARREAEMTAMARRQRARRPPGRGASART